MRDVDTWALASGGKEGRVHVMDRPDCSYLQQSATYSRGCEVESRNAADVNEDGKEHFIFCHHSWSGKDVTRQDAGGTHTTSVVNEIL